MSIGTNISMIGGIYSRSRWMREESEKNIKRVVKFVRSSKMMQRSSREGLGAPILA